MAGNEQLITAIIDNIALGLYTDKDQAIADLVEAGLSLDDATLNVNSLGSIMVGWSLEEWGLESIEEDCPVATLNNQSCDDRIRQLWVLGYI